MMSYAYICMSYTLTSFHLIICINVISYMYNVIEFFKLLFGNATESMLYEDPEAGDASTYMHLIGTPLTTILTNAGNRLPSSDEVVDYAETLLTAIFGAEIEKRLAMGTYKTASRIPEIISKGQISEACDRASACLLDDQYAITSRPSLLTGWDGHIWTNVESITEWICCVYDMLATERHLLGKLIDTFQTINRYPH